MVQYFTWAKLGYVGDDSPNPIFITGDIFQWGHNMSQWIIYPDGSWISMDQYGSVVYLVHKSTSREAPGHDSV